MGNPNLQTFAEADADADALPRPEMTPLERTPLLEELRCAYFPEAHRRPPRRFWSLLSSFDAHGCEFVVVGGYGVVHWGYPRSLILGSIPQSD